MVVAALIWQTGSAIHVYLVASPKNSSLHSTWPDFSHLAGSFRKLGVPYLGVPYNKDPTIKVLYLDPLFFGNSQLDVVKPGRPCASVRVETVSCEWHRRLSTGSEPSNPKLHTLVKISGQYHHDHRRIQSSESQNVSRYGCENHLGDG